jgi:hypothetical protein
MIWRSLDSLIVLATFAAIYLIPPLLALRRFQPPANLTSLCVISAGLGLSSQALLGFFWNHFVSHAPISEGVAYFLFWLTIGLALHWWPMSTQSPPSPLSAQRTTLDAPTLLPLILLGAIILRSLDALNHASLGQSDAYTHLQFLRDVCQQGQIRNIVYPPGYAWVLALPVMTFNLDAYLVARYVGPFFGALLVATLYLLGRRHSQVAGLYAAFLSAICPLFYPLIKTGMGAFANQLGLFLLPLALLLYLMEARFLFAIILLGLTVTVPLFVFTLLLLIGVHRLLCFPALATSRSCSLRHSRTQEEEFEQKHAKIAKAAAANTPQPHDYFQNSNPLYLRRRRNYFHLRGLRELLFKFFSAPNHGQKAIELSRKDLRQWLRENLLLLLPFLLAFALAGYHFLTPGKLHVNTTAALVTGIDTPSLKKHSANTRPPTLFMKIKANPAGKLTVDLLTVKRLGLGNTFMNLAALGLVGIFTGILIAGFRLGKPRPPQENRGAYVCGGRGLSEPSSDILKLVGCWGLLTTLQAATGFLEFSLYQRSGWVLMEAITLAGGLIIAWFHGLERLRKLIRPLIVLCLTASMIIAFWAPPEHRCITSGAENELATILRELSAARLKALHARGPIAAEQFEPSPLIIQAASAPHLTIITRRYTLFDADQGNIADVTPDPSAMIKSIPIEINTKLQAPSDHFLCLVDRSSGLPDMGLLARISPQLTQSLAGFQPVLYKPNDVILAFLSGLPADLWRVTREARGPNLSVYLVERLHP